MSRIAATFASAAAERRIAIIPYLTVGHPEPCSTIELAPALVEAGADLIELGIPFSDPLADGATIQRSSHQALQQGVTVAHCVMTAAELRSKVSKPIVFMSYYNPILHYGIERFCGDCAIAGVDGLIVPDLPPEEASELRLACSKNEMDLVFLVAPTSTDERLARIAQKASGFVYCVALAGTTGARASLAGGLRDFVARVRQHTDLPLVVGFGISRPEHVAELASYADGAVVGSALIDLLDRSLPGERVSQAKHFISSLRQIGSTYAAAGTR